VDRRLPSGRSSSQALKNIIAEVETLISTTTPMPENRTTLQKLLKA